MWILCLLCVRHLWKKEKIPWFKLTLLKMVEFQQQQMLLRNTVIIATVNFKWLHTHLQGSHFRESFNSFLKFAFIEYHCNSLWTHNLYIVKNLAMLKFYHSWDLEFYLLTHKYCLYKRIASSWLWHEYCTGNAKSVLKQWI